VKSSKASAANRLAVKADDAFSALTQTDFDEMLALYKALPTAVTDQFDAGARDTRVLFEGLHGLLGGQRLPREYPDIPEWVRLAILSELMTFMAGAGRTCVHCDLRRPQPMLAVAWKPGLVVCRYCYAMTKPTKAENEHCDHCGVRTDTFSSLVVPWGLLIWEAGICTDCYNELKAVLRQK
jgi:hypothetical protein